MELDPRTQIVVELFTKPNGEVYVRARTTAGDRAIATSAISPKDAAEFVSGHIDWLMGE
jgi:hypothetical protein